MKKLFLSLSALILSGVTVQVFADVPENAYVYNVSADKFLSRGGNWNTQAVLDDYGIPFSFTKGDDGYYTISVIDGLNSGCLGYDLDNPPYVDTSGDNARTYILTEQSDGYYISQSDLTIDQYMVKGAILAEGLPFYGLAGSSTPEVWKLLTSAERDTIIANRAKAQYTTYGNLSEMMSVDCSSSLLSDLSTSAKGWTWTTAPFYGSVGVSAITNNGSVSEVYEGNGSISTTVTGLTPGIYKVSVNGFHRMWWIGYGNYTIDFLSTWPNYSSAYIEANGNRQQIYAWGSYGEAVDDLNTMTQAATTFNKGNYLNEVYAEVGEDGTLNISLNQYYYHDGIWVIYGNAKIARMVDVNYQVYQDLRAEADSLLNEVMNSTVKEALEKVISDQSSIDGTTGADALLEAFNTLNDAVDNARTSIKAYANAADVLPQMKALTETTNFYTEDLYKSYYQNYQDAYDDCTLSDEDAASLTDPFVVSGWHSDVNISAFLNPAWTITIDGNTQDASYNASLYINTWSTEGDTDESNFKVPFFEYWVGGTNVLSAATIVGTVNGLAPGKYTVTADVRKYANGTPQNITMSVNEGDTVDVSGGTTYTATGDGTPYLDTFNAIGEVGEDSILKVTFAVGDNSNVSWLSFQNVKYEEIVPSLLPVSPEVIKSEDYDYYESEEITLSSFSGETITFASDVEITSVDESLIKVYCVDDNGRSTLNLTATAENNVLTITTEECTDPAYYTIYVAEGAVVAGAKSNYAFYLYYTVTQSTIDETVVSYPDNTEPQDSLHYILLEWTNLTLDNDDAIVPLEEYGDTPVVYASLKSGEEVITQGTLTTTDPRTEEWVNNNQVLVVLDSVVYAETSTTYTLVIPEKAMYYGDPQRGIYNSEITIEFIVSTPTGIGDAKVALASDDKVYTLSGLRIESKSLKSGVYIVNGKKFLVK